MSIIYNVITGDTFESIARKQYGTEQESNRIAQANPGVTEPLIAGIVLNIPDIPNAPADSTRQAPADNDNETAIFIDNKRFRFWDSVRIFLSMDSIDTISFGAPFKSDLAGFRQAFRPLSFQTVDVTVGGEILFTGTMITPLPTISNNDITISVNAYALPGVLNDCTPPASALPLEFNGQKLKDIFTKLTEPFGINVEFDADQGALFEQVATDSSKKILSFCIDLAKQRNLIITNTPKGALLVHQSVKPGNPVARLKQGESPVLSITPSFKSQDYYTHITGINPVEIGTPGSQHTIKNSRLNSTIRPLTFKVKDATNSNLKAAVEAKIGRMFANAVTYSVSVDTWRDPLGNKWKPNTTLTLFAPDAMVYSEYEFTIRNIEFIKQNSEEIATLNLILPGAFNGEIPEVLPWDE